MSDTSISIDGSKTHAIFQDEETISFSGNANFHSKNIMLNLSGHGPSSFNPSCFQIMGNTTATEQYEDPEMLSLIGLAKTDSYREPLDYFFGVKTGMASNGDLNGDFLDNNTYLQEIDGTQEIHGFEDQRTIAPAENGYVDPQRLFVGIEFSDETHDANDFVGKTHVDANLDASVKYSLFGASENAWPIDYANEADATNDDIDWESSIDTDKTLVAEDITGYLKTLVNFFSALEFEKGLSTDAILDCPIGQFPKSFNEPSIPKTANTRQEFISPRELDLLNLFKFDNTPEERSKSLPELGTDTFVADILGAGTSQVPQNKSKWCLQRFIKNNSISLSSSSSSVSSRNVSSSASRANSRSGSISPSRRKKQRIEPKPIPPHFKVCPGYKVSLQNSHVKCLDVNLDYHGYEGRITEIVLNNAITNYYRDASFDLHNKPPEMRSPLRLTYEFQPGERLEGDHWCEHPDGLTSEIHCHMGFLERKIYIRDISDIVDLVTRITYLQNNDFNIYNPYDPQYTRYEIDESGKLINETKCGLCAFCNEVKFLPFKNSSYLSHMTLEHGIFSDNFVVPEGTNFGKYLVPKGDEREPEKTKEIEGLQCPACLEIVEMNCWSTKKNPLLKYFRHYKKEHVKDNKKQSKIQSKINPLDYKRGRESR